MSETSSRVRLMANLQAAVAEAVSGTMEERGRGFASDREAWAELKECIERKKPKARTSSTLRRPASLAHCTGCPDARRCAAPGPDPGTRSANCPSPATLPPIFVPDFVVPSMRPHGLRGRGLIDGLDMESDGHFRIHFLSSASSLSESSL